MATRKPAKTTHTSRAKTAKPKRRGRTFELRIGIRASRETVWDAIAGGPGLVRWYCRSAEIEPRAGGAYRFAWGDAAMRGDVLGVSPRRRLDLSWHHDTSVSLRLARRHGGRETVVTLRHGGIPAALSGVEVYAQLRQGWTFSLVNLKSVLERGVDLRDKDRRRTFARGWVNCWD